MDYPRDLIGYGANVPRADWPGNARVAVQFVLNYEEGGESCVLHGDPGSEQFLSEIIGAAAYPARHLTMESIYEYGSRAGVWRVLRRHGLVDVASDPLEDLVAAQMARMVAAGGEPKRRLRYVAWGDVPR